jgi:hypothetical protein
MKPSAKIGLLAALIAVAAGGCGGLGHARVYPLYPSSAPAPRPDEIAVLMGPVATVDGVNVQMHGRTFGLLPGCHVVTLMRKIGETNATGGWIADFPPAFYAMRMRPGRYYRIQIRTPTDGGPRGEFFISAEEDLPGAAKQPIFPARGDADIARCRDWAAAGGH